MDIEYLEQINELIDSIVHEYALPIYNSNYMKNYENHKNIQFTINDQLFLETLLY